MGFQSCSKNITVSAEVRLRPRPPTCVVSSSTGMEGSALKRCTMLNRADASTLLAQCQYQLVVLCVPHTALVAALKQACAGNCARLPMHYTCSDPEHNECI